jgi:hypothetical protein
MQKGVISRLGGERRLTCNKVQSNVTEENKIVIIKTVFRIIMTSYFILSKFFKFFRIFRTSESKHRLCSTAHISSSHFPQTEHYSTLSNMAVLFQ